MQNKLKGLITLLIFIMVAGSISPVGHSGNSAERIILNQQEKLDYVAYQLGLFSYKDQSATREVIKLLREYKSLVSVGVGMSFGLLAGLLANWMIKACGYVETDAKVYWNLDSGRSFPRLIASTQSARQDVNIVSMAVTPILIYTILTKLEKTASSDTNFYRRKFEAFLKDWHKHKYLTPYSLEPVFEKFYEHYLVYGHTLLFDDVLIQELLKKVVHLLVLATDTTIVEQSHNADVSVNVIVSDERDHQSVGYGGSSVRSRIR